MKTLATAGIILAVLGIMLGAAGAADIPVVKPPEPAPIVWSWNGFYGGLNAGFASAQSDTTVTFLNTVTGAPLLPRRVRLRAAQQVRAVGLVAAKLAIISLLITGCTVSKVIFSGRMKRAQAISFVPLPLAV